MTLARATPSAEVKREIAQLLRGLKARRNGQGRASPRRPAELKTTIDCPALNRWFMTRARVDNSWTSEDTWVLLERRLTVEGDFRPEVLAIREVLCLNPETAAEDVVVRRTAAASHLGMTYNKNDFALHPRGSVQTYSSPILHVMVDAVSFELEAAARSSAVAERSRTRVDPLRSTDESASRVLNDLARESAEQIDCFALGLADQLDRPAPRYPSHLTPSVLASTMTVTRSESRSVRGLHAADRLYGGPVTRGGELALPALKRVRRAVLLGDPGGGKSTILAAHAIGVIRDDQLPNVIICRLSDVAERLVEEDAAAEAHQLLETLVQVSRRSYAVPETVDSEAMARALQEQPDALIVLDGLDEVPAQKLHLVRRLIERLDDVRGSVLVSSRHAGYEPLGSQWIEFTTDHLSLEQGMVFLDAWFGKPRTEAYQRAVEAIQPGGHASLGEIPVLLGIVAVVAGHGEVPEGRAQLYRKYLDLFLAKAWDSRRPVPDEIEQERQLKLASRLAWSMAVGGRSGVVGAQWTDLTTVGMLLRVTQPSEKTDAQRLVRHSGLFTPVGGDGFLLEQPIRWLHRTIHEHLAGSFLADLHQDDHRVWSRYFEQMIQGNTSWHVPLEHMMGMLDERDQREVVERAATLQAAGDPGEVILSALMSLAAGAPDGASIRDRVARIQAAAGRWTAAAELSRSEWRRLVLAAVGGQMLSEPHLEYDSYRGNMELLQLGLSEDELKKVAEHFLTEIEENPKRLADKVTVLSWLDPNESFCLATQYLGDPDFPRFPSTDTRPPTMEGAIKIVGALDGREMRLDALDYLAQLDMDVELMFEGDLVIGPDAAAIGELRRWEADWMPSKLLDPSLPHIKAALRGELGDLMALRFGYFVGADRATDSRSLSRWVLVGNADRTLRGAFDNISPWAANNDGGGAANALAVFQRTDLIEPDHVRNLIVSLDCIIRSGTRVSTGELLSLYYRISLAREAWGRSEGSEAWLVWAVSHEIMNALGRLLAQRHDLVDELMRTEARRWRHADGLIYEGFLVEHSREGLMTESSFWDLLRWAQEARATILTSLEFRSNYAIWLSNAGSSGLSLNEMTPDDVRQVARWFASANMLSEHRTDLIEATTA